jgi:hypothetical protein
MTYTVKLLIDEGTSNTPVLLVHGDGTFEPATSMAIIGRGNKVVLPFKEGCGGNANGIHFFHFAVGASKKDVKYRVIPRTTDGYPLGKEQIIIMPGTSTKTPAGNK